RPGSGHARAGVEVHHPVRSVGCESATRCARSGVRAPPGALGGRWADGIRQDEPMDRQQEYVLRTIEERDIRFVRLWFTDVLGALKSVAVAPAELEQAFAEGIGFDGSAIAGFTRVYEADMIVQPDASTFTVIPWRGDNPGTARMFCDIRMPEGSPAGSDSRHVLRRALDSAAEDGFTFYTHPEIEFYLFKEPYDAK